MTFKKRDIVLFFIFSFMIGLFGAFIALKLTNGEFAIGNKEGSILQGEELNSEIEEDLYVIQQAYDIIQRHYIEDVEKDQLIEGAIQGMLQTLGDPHSSYMNAEVTAKFNEQISASFQGIGAEVSMVDGVLTVVAPIKDSPAEKAGLRPNDQILQVDHETIEGLDLHEAVDRIRGEKGSEVSLLVQREGSSKPFEVTIVRDEIPLDTVFTKIEEKDGKKSGIIQIVSFAETTADEFSDALLELEADSIDGLVIDVRDNPGGLLHAIEEILVQFVPDSVPYLQIEDGNGNVEEYYSSLKEKKPYPITVLINEGSASSSEILAIAMKEIGYDVVGETSFGKGTVQQALPIHGKDGEGMMKLTFYKWLSPKGNWINEVGVEPTVKQKQPDFYYVQPLQLEDTLTYDETDELIGIAQTMLKGLGYDVKRDDGYFDNTTEDAVKQFQEEKGLSVTGEIDEKTANEIQMAIIDLIRSGEQDVQLEKAIEVLYK